MGQRNSPSELHSPCQNLLRLSQLPSEFKVSNCPPSSWTASPSEGKRGRESQVHSSLLRSLLAWRTCLFSSVTSRSAASPSNSWSSDLFLQLEWSPGTRKAPGAGRDKALLVLPGAGRIQLTHPRAASCCQAAKGQSSIFTGAAEILRSSAWQATSTSGHQVSPGQSPLLAGESCSAPLETQPMGM